MCSIERPEVARSESEAKQRERVALVLGGNASGVGVDPSAQVVEAIEVQ